MNDDEAKKAILARRARFVAAAVAGLAACEPRSPNVPAPTDDGGTITVPPSVCLSPPQVCLSSIEPPQPPPRDAGAVIAPPQPTPCLSVAPNPTPCLSPPAPPHDAGKPKPKPKPTICLFMEMP
jgi:hypothetical protein